MSKLLEFTHARSLHRAVHGLLRVLRGHQFRDPEQLEVRGREEGNPGARRILGAVSDLPDILPRLFWHLWRHCFFHRAPRRRQRHSRDQDLPQWRPHQGCATRTFRVRKVMTL
jgi:hypothetical protein